MSNFDFIKIDFPVLYKDAVEAEQLVIGFPKPSAILMRSVLENAVNWLFENDNKLKRPWKSDLSTLMCVAEFKLLFAPALYNELHLIRKIGNAAAHGKGARPDDVMASLKYLFRFMRHLSIYYGKNPTEKYVFDEALIPNSQQEKLSKQDQVKQIKKLTDNLDFKNRKAREDEKKLAEQIKDNALLKQQLEQHKLELAARKVEREKTVNVETAIPLLISEAETRRRYIDVSLRECGWNDLQQDRDLEYKVTGMPKSTNPSGIGYVDYVLWGDDGLPLAVVEAKKSMESPRKGKHQAVLYADCLQKMHEQRPIIFYSNGFETYLWDDEFSAERQVQGFYDKDELQLMIDRRDPITGRKDIRKFEVNLEIAGKGRPYQLEAIKRVAENSVLTNSYNKLMSKSRRSLLVMATGSGKTRTSAAIVDMFTKCNWAKRVLFLADRNALVRQAKNAFNENLPHLTAIDLTKEKEDSATRLVFSTYPTIMNRIDGIRDGDERFYGVGHFDLIIIDEAHRSVYQKYRAIFEYFDAMLIGLTATPKADVDHNTYELFGIEDNNPTFAYELVEAVDQGHLVPPRGKSVPLKFQREGIKYQDLSDAEKEEYEEKFGDPSSEEAPDEISSSALNKWLFNTNTVDKVLSYLMTEGIKVNGGDKLGKTIIFAKNHKHAVFIEERFNKNYPEYAGKFLRVIDNYESKAQDLLEIFVDHYVENDPQIAVSVDMMDTGVDAPRVVNLVFFKRVMSPTKFWQMIGRGTRLCPDLFGPGENKEHFAIFDFCENFEFFDANPDGIGSSNVKSLIQQIFEAKLELALLIRDNVESTEEQFELAELYIDEIHQGVASLNTENFEVKKELRYVTEFSNKVRWSNISKNDMLDINTHLSHLILAVEGDDELARRFDVLILNYQLALLTGAHSTVKFASKINSIAVALYKKHRNIPDIGLQADLLKDVQTDEFWESININRLDNVRVSLRDLLKYLDKETQPTVYTNFEDHLDFGGTREVDLMPSFTNLQSYKDRVESYVREHSDHLVIRKLKNNQPITPDDLIQLEEILFDDHAIGSKQEYIKAYGDQPLGTFIRFIVGLDVKAAQEAFAGFINSGNLKADQLTFINNIIKHLTKNGVIDKRMLFEPPFTNLHDQGLLGVFNDSQANQVVELIDGINGNALVGTRI